MITLAHLPNGLHEIVDVYGNCLDPEFYIGQLQWVRAPFTMRLSWHTDVKAGGFLAHRLVGPAMVDALQEILDTHGLDYLRANNLDLYGGVYNLRGKRTAKQMSTHAWGIAIDWCPAFGYLGCEPTMPEFIVQAFTKRGFEWGGNWPLKDGAHWQACTGY